MVVETGPSSDDPQTGKNTFRRQGFTVPMYTFVGGGKSESQLRASLTQMTSTGANSVILDYHLLLRDGYSGDDVVQHPDHPLSYLATEIQVAKSLGLHVSVKPVMMVGTAVNWQIAKPGNPDAWFSNYRPG